MPDSIHYNMLQFDLSRPIRLYAVHYINKAYLDLFSSC